MQKNVEHAKTNNRLSPATVELLIRERSKGKTLRQLGQIFNRSHERIRQVLAKYGPPQVTLLPEERVAAKLRYPGAWLVWLRKEGIIKPIKPGSLWLYSEEQVGQIPALITEARKCASDAVSNAHLATISSVESVASIRENTPTYF